MQANERLRVFTDGDRPRTRLDDFQRDFFLSPFSTTSHFPIRNPREFIACKNCYITVNDAGLSIGGNDFAANKRAAVVDRRFERSDEGLV